jgi:hypothetical protein
MEDEKLMLEWIRQQGDSREGIASFLERRVPKWRSSKNADIPGLVEIVDAGMPKASS